MAAVLPSAQRMALLAQTSWSLIATERELSRQSGSKIFETVYNPTNARTGAKYLKKALVGPKIVDYYGEIQGMPRIAQLAKVFPEMGLVDHNEQERLERIEMKKRRGKGPPKKG